MSICTLLPTTRAFHAGILAAVSLAAGFGLCLVNPTAAEQEKRAADEADATHFRDNVLPILTGKCLACHDGYKRKGGLDLSRMASVLKGGDNGTALKPGNAAESLLYKRVEAGQMPEGNPLSAEQIASFKKWIEAGAKYDKEPLLPTGRAGPDWWSLQRIVRPEPPPVKDERWVRTPLDRFILAKLEDKDLKPAAEADKVTLLRRVTFDLTGLPPTPEEVTAFLKDNADDAYEKRVEQLLASPRYGERWGRHWLDVVRFAESYGYETNTLRPNAWPYRDYVIRAFNDDIPYPRFVLEQLAGDTIPGADPLTQAATGFLVGGSHDTVGNATPEGSAQQRMDDLDDMITATASTFLGMTVNCARCHDHKFDPIPQKDYYRLQAVFAGVRHADPGQDREIPTTLTSDQQREADGLRDKIHRLDAKLDEFEPEYKAGTENRRPAVNPRRNVERFQTVEAKVVRFTIAATNNKTEPCIDELEIYAAGEPTSNVALASNGSKATASSCLPNVAIHQIAHLNDGKHGNSWSWISNEPGRGWVQIELPNAMKIDRIVWSRDREEKFSDRVPVGYRIEVEAEPGRWREVASSDDRRPFQSSTQADKGEGLSGKQNGDAAELVKERAALDKKLAALTQPFRIYMPAFSQPGPTYLLKRGDPLQKGLAVTPGGLSAVNPNLSLTADISEKERRLALAKWIAHPDNPLPARVMVNRVFAYHFGQGIVSTPSDFGFNGGRPTHPELLDWLASEFKENGWHLKPLHRVIVLSAAYRQGGRIDPKAQAIDKENTLLWRRAPRRLEAEAVRDSVLAVSSKLDLKMGGPGYEIWEKNTNYVTVFKPKEELGPDEFRRMVYQFKPRSQQDPIFGTFDCPDAALARPKRTTSTTVLQALNLFNSKFTQQQAGFFEQRLQREAGDDAGRQVTRAFQLVFGREPTTKERDGATALVREHGLSALCRALFNANEFLYVD
jgi:Protein of unknown function (DUF1553)/Protein of unknown function (DUF1549)/Planctomycete cytochrome C